jgi:hypothetical protein
MIINPYVFGIPLDPDAQAFLTAASISDATITSAINTLVLDLKANNLWTKMKAIYPFVGGTASTHKWNLKDPQDTNAAFRLVFFGGWTHSSLGATPNAINAFAETNFNPFLQLTTSSAHFSKYNRTLDLAGNKADGSFDGTNFFFQQNYTSANGLIGEVGAVASYTATDTRGMFTVSRIATNAQKVFRNSTQVAVNNTGITGLPNRSVYIGARQDAGPVFLNSYQCAFASLGTGLTDTDVSNLYTLVQTFQTTLSRQV